MNDLLTTVKIRGICAEGLSQTFRGDQGLLMVRTFLTLLSLSWNFLKPVGAK